METRRIAAAVAFVAALATAACVDRSTWSRESEPRVAAAVLVPDSGPVEISFSRLRPAAAMGGEMTRGGGPVEAAARQILADLGQTGDARSAAAAALVTSDALGRGFDRLQRHVAAAWHFDFDPASVDFLRVRLRAAIAPDGSVRAIELLDSHGGPEEVLARFVEDAIATLDWSSPLPLDGGTGPMRALVFRFEAGRARR